MGKFKFLAFLIILTLVVSVQIVFNSLISKAEENGAQTNKNYFLIGKNNFEDPTIDKGELDKKIDLVKGKMTAPRDPADANLTYNEFYLKYNFAPEMSNSISNRYGENPYNYRNSIDRNGAAYLYKYDSHANALLNGTAKIEYATVPDDKTFQVGVTVPQVPDSFTGKTGVLQVKPIFFSYLYVGDGIAGQNNNYQYNTDSIFPDTIGYNEKNKVSDYLLSEKNNFVIPTRYNAQRGDITLLMRSKTEVNTNSPNVYLDVKDEDDKQVVGKATNPNYYIDTKVSLHVTEYSYNRVSGAGAFGYKNIDPVNNGYNPYGKKNGLAIPADKFNTEMNSLLKTVRSQSTQGIVMGVGGAVKLNGFYRDGLEEFTASNTERTDDQEKLTKVNFYMLQNETTPAPADTGRTWKDDALADEVDGIKNVITPEVSKFKLSTTRPTITTDKAVNFNFDPDKNDFNTLLGQASVDVNDEGVSNFVGSDGKAKKIPVDLDNLRVRVKEAGTTDWSAAMIPAALKDVLDDYRGKDIQVAYVYSATDAEDENIGLLPEEIEDNTGAYAIPLVKQVKIAALKEITVKYVVQGDENGEALESKKNEGKQDDPFTHIAPPTYKKDGKEYVLVTTPDTKTTTYTVEPQTLVFVYKVKETSNVKEYGTITVRYVDEAGNVLETGKPKTGIVGEDYTTNSLSIFVKDGKTYHQVAVPENSEGKYTAGNTNVDYVYRQYGLVTATYTTLDGKVLRKAETFNGALKSRYQTTKYETIKVGEDEYKLTKTPANATGEYTGEDITVNYVYELVVQEGKVIVRYVDEKGKVLQTKDPKTGKVKEEYTTSAPKTVTIDGVVYERVTTKDPDNVTGEYTADDIYVDYVYKKKTTTNTTTINEGKDTNKDDPDNITPDKEDETTKTDDAPKNSSDSKDDESTPDTTKEETTSSGENKAANTGLTTNSLTPIPVADTNDDSTVTDVSEVWENPTTAEPTNKTATTKDVTTTGTNNTTDAVSKNSVLPQTNVNEAFNKYLSGLGVLVLLGSILVFRRKV